MYVPPLISASGPVPAGPVGSTYVPLDSWVYPALQRLAALGYVESDFQAQRPWTRTECARLTAEAERLLNGDRRAEQAAVLLQELLTEFAAELRGEETVLAVESIYSRFQGTGGTPLTDGFHFSQSLTNDFGRIHGEGANFLGGAAVRATYGRFAFYVRGEYQTAGEVPMLPAAARTEIGGADLTPAPAPIAPHRVQRFRLLESYVSLNLANIQFSAGKQALWWGAGPVSAFSMSHNADPVLMLRGARVTPIKLPWLLGLLGPVKGEAFFGQLDGHSFTFNVPILYGPKLRTQPFIHGEKFSFKPTPNLEFGISRTSVIGGDGLPLTFRNVYKSYFTTGNFGPGFPDDPGDRRAGFDFRYRIPGLRNWLQLYNDSMAEDEISPIAYPRRSAMNPGIYMPQLPGLPRVDLRAEGIYTNLPGLRNNGYFFANGRYRSGYTNDGNILGSWIGRQAHGVVVSSTYWKDARNSYQFTFRRVVVDKSFMAGGGNHSTFTARVNLRLAEELYLHGFAQVDDWRFPVLGPRRERSTMVQAELRFEPRKRLVIR